MCVKMTKNNITELLNSSNGKYINQEIYDSLLKIAKYSLRNSPSNSTMRTSDVVNEAVLKVYNKNQLHFDSRGCFYSLMSQIMRNLVIDYARKKQARKNGGEYNQITLSYLESDSSNNNHSLEKMLEIESAIFKLSQKDKQLEELIVMRFYGGVSVTVLADYYDTSESTIKRKLRFAQTFLKTQIS